MTTTHLALTAPKTVGWKEVPHQALGANDVRVRCQYGAEKHGTMAAFYKGYGNQRGRWDGNRRCHVPGDGVLWNFPIPLGNMAVGTVLEIGSAVTHVKPGDRVTTFGPFSTELVSGANRCWKISADLPWQSAVCIDPTVFALGAIRDGHVRMGDKVVVFGLGAIGLCAVQLAKAAGATVFACDPVAERREIALATGAVKVFGAPGEDVGALLRDATGGVGVDVAIDFSGSLPALQAAIRGVGYHATIVCGAFPAPFPAGLDLGGEAHMNRPTIIFSRGCSDPNPDHPRWDEERLILEAVRLVSTGVIDGRRLVGPVVKPAELVDAYTLVADQPGKGIKLSVDFT